MQSQTILGCIASPKSFPASCSNDVRNSWRDWMLMKLAGAIFHGSLLLATAPQMFPADRFVFSSCRAGVCEFVTVDSVRGSAAAAPGRCHHYCAQGWQPTTTGSAPTLLQMGLSEYVASPGRVFFAPARDRGYRVRCWIGCAPLGIDVSHRTIFHGKDSDGFRRCV